jgi:hypothetical protein
MDDEERLRAALLVEHEERRHALLAAPMSLASVNAVLEDVSRTLGWRVVHWDILQEPSYYNDTIPIHRRLGKYMSSSSAAATSSPVIIIRVADVDIDLGTRTSSVQELLACINDPAVRQVVLHSSHPDPFGPQSVIGKRSKTQIESVVTRVCPLPKKAAGKAKKDSANTRRNQCVVARDVALFKLVASHPDTCESCQAVMQSIADAIDER